MYKSDKNQDRVELQVTQDYLNVGKQTNKSQCIGSLLKYKIIRCWTILIKFKIRS